MNYTTARSKIEQGTFLIYQGSGMIKFYPGGENSTPDFHHDFARSVTEGCIVGTSGIGWATSQRAVGINGCHIKWYPGIV